MVGIVSLWTDNDGSFFLGLSLKGCHSYTFYLYSFVGVSQGLQPQQAAQPAPQQAGPQPGAAAQNGQPDYSAQWAEYYRSIGKVKEAEAIEAQMKAGKVN
jgi:hypothetical protein